VRREIDRLDAHIVALLAERALYVAQAAGFKPTEAAVVVPERIEAVVAKARAIADQWGADADLIEAIYRPMIDAFISFERARWRELVVRF
jgi:isochorismate pyruvate lyase